ncbi:MAG TPA: hypothetical protein VNG71_13910 [Pyrinomonadaceae bacterium]|nr:hypothetical protein [Pyrinomonadaceae bacterium]
MFNRPEEEKTETIFKPIPGFPGYVACNDGSVWSARKNSWRRLKEWFCKDRWYVGPFLEGKQVKYPRAYFVLRAFHPAPDVVPGRRLICRHLDGNAQDDRPNNLAWGSYQQNSQDVLYHGRHGFTIETVRRIRELAQQGFTYPEIALQVGCSPELARRLSAGKTAGYLPNPDGTRYTSIRRNPLPMDTDLKARVAIDLQAGLSMRKIAKRFGISKDQVWKYSRKVREIASSN